MTKLQATEILEKEKERILEKYVVSGAAEAIDIAIESLNKDIEESNDTEVETKKAKSPWISCKKRLPDIPDDSKYSEDVLATDGIDSFVAWLAGEEWKSYDERLGDVVALIAYLIASSKGAGAQAIMNLVENAWGAFGASFGSVIILSLFWRNFNYKGAVAGIIAGFAVDLGWLFSGLTSSTGIYELLPGFIAGMIVAFVVAAMPPTLEKEQAVFDKAQANNK